MIYVFEYMSFYKCILCIYLSIYLNLCIGRVVGKPIPYKDIWHTLDM